MSAAWMQSSVTWSYLDARIIISCIGGKIELSATRLIWVFTFSSDVGARKSIKRESMEGQKVCFPPMQDVIFFLFFTIKQFLQDEQLLANDNYLHSKQNY